jgi:hypothetical protein
MSYYEYKGPRKEGCVSPDLIKATRKQKNLVIADLYDNYSITEGDAWHTLSNAEIIVYRAKRIYAFKYWDHEWRKCRITI